MKLTVNCMQFRLTAGEASTSFFAPLDIPEVHSVFKLNRKLVLVALSWSCSLD